MITRRQVMAGAAAGLALAQVPVALRPAVAAKKLLPRQPNVKGFFKVPLNFVAGRPTLNGRIYDPDTLIVELSRYQNTVPIVWEPLDEPVSADRLFTEASPIGHVRKIEYYLGPDMEINATTASDDVIIRHSNFYGNWLDKPGMEVYFWVEPIRSMDAKTLSDPNILITMSSIGRTYHPPKPKGAVSSRVYDYKISSLYLTKEGSMV